MFYIRITKSISPFLISTIRILEYWNRVLGVDFVLKSYLYISAATRWMTYACCIFPQLHDERRTHAGTEHLSPWPDLQPEQRPAAAQDVHWQHRRNEHLHHSEYIVQMAGREPLILLNNCSCVCFVLFMPNLVCTCRLLISRGNLGLLPRYLWSRSMSLLIKIEIQSWHTWVAYLKIQPGNATEISGSMVQGPFH